jgi:steroid 5-alpha reductase family enzyme
MNVPTSRPWGGLVVVTLAYAIAFAAAVGVVFTVPGDWHPLLKMVVADLAATLVLFFVAYAVDNTAMFNAHWSLAPIAIAFWFAFGPGVERHLDARQIAVLALVTFYGVRLTFNWVRSWGGLKHEDWQYEDYRKKTGKAFWAFSLGGFHLFPMALVLASCLPLYGALVPAGNPFGVIDVLACIVMFGAVVIEGAADNQLRAFRLRAKPGEHCDAGLWSWSRHPNYFGEVSVWFGLWLFGVAAGAPWWAAAGWLAMAGLFLGVSVPMAEKRSHERRPGYAAYAQRTSLFVPLPPKK